MTAAPHHCHPEASEGPCIWISLEDLLFQHFRSTLSVEYKVPRRPRDDSNLGVVVKHMMTATPHHCHPEASEGSGCFRLAYINHTTPYERTRLFVETRFIAFKKTHIINSY